MLENDKLRCRICGSRYIQSKIKCLCADCVYKSTHGGKSKQEVAIERQKLKIVKPKKIYKYKRKDTGEKVLFLEIWSEREHICVNCKTYLGNTPRNWMFSHKVAKGVDKSLRLSKDNIDLLCWDCHYAWEFCGKDKYNEKYKQ